MKTILLAITALLTGCATPFRPPPEAAHVRLERVASPTVLIDKVWLERGETGVFVTGHVLRRLGAHDTTGTHLDVTAYNAGRRILAETTTDFIPRQIPQRVRHRSLAVYRTRVDAPPDEITRIEVRAHDGAHITR